jgi:curved DNA-binding protein CbpA
LLEKYGPHVSIDECDPDRQIKMMKTINEAYQILINPSRRKMHDMELTRYFGNEDVRKISTKAVEEKPPRGDWWT